ncbi:hypothetical protein PSEUDO8O_20081 [Pseudomonas sp. 8O]|nr:hypothetical protein PSEUDO8O_20081 [Pseudomonas sp. 8O]
MPSCLRHGIGRAVLSTPLPLGEGPGVRVLGNSDFSAHRRPSPQPSPEGEGACFHR